MYIFLFNQKKCHRKIFPLQKETTKTAIFLSQLEISETEVFEV